MSLAHASASSDAAARRWLDAECDTTARTLIHAAVTRHAVQSTTLTGSDLREATRLDSSTAWLTEKLESSEAEARALRSGGWRAPSSLEASSRGPSTLHPSFLEDADVQTRGLQPFRTRVSVHFLEHEE